MKEQTCVLLLSLWQPRPLIKSSQASQGRSGHSGDLGIHSCCQALLESTKITSLFPQILQFGHGEMPKLHSLPVGSLPL